MARAQDTRKEILDVAERAILQKGFEATSIEEIVAAVGITKSGFFYHFPDKNTLAHDLLKRYIETETKLFDDLFDRARELNDDPLHAMLIGLKLLAELLDDLPNGHPGCLVASACYQDRLFDDNVRNLNKQAMLSWRKRFHTMFLEIAEAYPPKEKVDLVSLSDMISTIVDGGIIVARALNEPDVLVKQVLQLRTYIKLLFKPD